MTQSKVVLTQRPTIPFVAPNTVVLYVQNDRLYMIDDEQEIFLVGPMAGDIAAIKAVTDNLPDSGALTSISDETDKIDGAAVDGLTGTYNSLAYRVHEIERHFHNYERWLGLAAAPNGEIHRADAIIDNPAPFVIDAGNNTWGSWVQILGSDDTPSQAGMLYYDLHQIDIVAAETANVIYFIQLAFGASGAEALAAGDYTEVVFIPQSAQGRPAPIPLFDRRKAVGTKAWARNLCRGTNTSTLSFYLGLHEYQG